MKHSDLFVGVVLLAFCAIIFWLTTSFTEVPAMLSQNVPPTFFPRLVVGIIAVLSVTLIFNGLRKTENSRERVEPAVFVTAAIVILAGIAVSYLGTLLTLSLVACAIPIAWGERRLRPIGILAVTLPAAIYLVFSVALGIRFPAGLLFGWTA
ncbi:MAG: tripartite tricarboxylate transporter TctB family protein [Candidatus Rariloculaceae bacterium]